MGKKMKLPFLSSQTDYHHQQHNNNNQARPCSSSSSTTNSWPWPSCTQTRTLSFKATTSHNNDMFFKTMNSTFSDTTNNNNNNNDNIILNDELEPRQHYDTLLFANSSPSHAETDDMLDRQSQSFSTASEDQSGVLDPVEAVIQGVVRSERLFFEPGETSSILEKANNNKHIEEEEDNVPFKESVALSLESRNPYMDFKKSMEDMVEAHGIKDWDGIEELLCWYLKMNGKDNHGFIVGAFVDLLVGLTHNNNNNNNNNSHNSKSCCKCSNCESPFSPLSFCNTTTTTTSSSCSSSMSSSSNTTPNCVSSSIVGVVVSSGSDDQEIETPCLSSLLETDEEEDNGNDNDDVSS